MVQAFLLLVVVLALCALALFIYIVARLKFTLFSDPFAFDDYLPASWDFTKAKLEEDL